MNIPFAVPVPRPARSALLAALLVPLLAHAQAIESYVQRKEAEKEQPNRYLQGQSLDRLDQLGAYYRRAFANQRFDRISPFGTNLTAGAADAATTKLPAGVALDGAIDPAQYAIGPMDVLEVDVWGDIPLNAPVTVTPEGSAIVPTVGEIPLRGLTLAEAKTAIVRATEKRYAKSTASVTLIIPRMFTVHVTGLVAAPGSYAVSPIDRADRAVALAMLAGAKEKSASTAPAAVSESDKLVSYAQEPVDATPAFSLRNVLLLRGGDTVYVDLIRYYATGDVTFNPRLRDGDVLVLMPEHLEANRIGIYGGVRMPGSFEYHPGDSLRALVRIAQGFSEFAVLDTIRVVRAGPHGSETIAVDGRKVADGTFDMPLARNDRVFVREHRPDVREATVTIRGEVRYAGGYPITPESTKLSEVIAEAGGFTARAAIAEAAIFRHQTGESFDPLDRVPDYERLRDMRLSELDHEEREYFTYEAALRRETVSADFRRLFVAHDSTADITLRDGDEIVVPSTTHSVYVYGQVVRPGYVAYATGMDAEFYIDRAGGYAPKANAGETRVIKAGSKNWVKPGDTTPEPGDAIFVPRSGERDFVFWFTAVRDFLQVAVSVVTVYLLFVQINRR